MSERDEFLRVFVREAFVAAGTSLPEGEQHRIAVEALSRVREIYAGDRVRVYVPSVGPRASASVYARIRALYTGANAALLAAQFGLSERQVRRIVKRRPDTLA